MLVHAIFQAREARVIRRLCEVQETVGSDSELKGLLALVFEERDAAIDRVDALENDVARLHRRITELETPLAGLCNRLTFLGDVKRREMGVQNAWMVAVDLLPRQAALKGTK